MWQWTGVHGHACVYAGRELCWGHTHTHTHAECSAQRQQGNSCGREAAEQQVSAAACTKASWGPAEQSLSSTFPEWKTLREPESWPHSQFTAFLLGNHRMHRWTLCLEQTQLSTCMDAKAFQWFCVPDTLNLFHALWHWGLGVLKNLLGT